MMSYGTGTDLELWRRCIKTAASKSWYVPSGIDYIPLRNRPERMKLGSTLDAGTSLLGPIGMAFLPQAIIT